MHQKSKAKICKNSAHIMKRTVDGIHIWREVFITSFFRMGIGNLFDNIFLQLKK